MRASAIGSLVGQGAVQADRPRVPAWRRAASRGWLLRRMREGRALRLFDSRAMPAARAGDATRFRDSASPVALGSGKIATQLFRSPAWTVARRIALNSPSLAQRAGIDRVEAKLIEKLRHPNLRSRLVAGNHQRTTVLRASRLAVSRELSGVDVIESLDHFRLGKVRLEQLGSSGRFVV